jgi:uncharacterized protein (TIGR00162 family)
MNETTIIELRKVKLKNAVLVTGLPGIGLIGRIAGRYMAEELKARKVAELYSPHFPHQVLMTRKGGMRPIKNKFYLAKTKKADLLLLIGDVQALNPEGQYEVAGKILDYAERVGVKRVLTVGGYSTGKLSDKRSIYGVVTHKEMIEEFKKYGVVFGTARGFIVGAAGLLPALGKLRGLQGACVMGETHGGYVDITAAKNIVAMLSQMLGFEIDTKKLETKAKESEKVLKRIEEESRKAQIQPFEYGKKECSYIR